MPNLNLYWNDNSSDEDNFILERKVAGGSFSTLATLGMNVTSYIDTTFLEDVDYVYRVYAQNAGGNSGYSNELPVRIESTVTRRGVRAVYV